MKTMIIAAAAAGVALAAALLVARKKITHIDAETLRDQAKKRLQETDGQPERSPLQTMG